jgi:hypothetical protein
MSQPSENGRNRDDHSLWILVDRHSQQLALLQQMHMTSVQRGERQTALLEQVRDHLEHLPARLSPKLSTSASGPENADFGGLLTLIESLRRLAIALAPVLALLLLLYGKVGWSDIANIMLPHPSLSDSSTP